MLRPYKQFLSFGRPFQYVRLHRVEHIRRIRKAPRRKMLFDLPQKCIALVVAGKINRHSALVVRCGRRRRAKLAATQSPQSRQSRPSQLIDHGWLLLRGRKTKKIAKPKANTINSPIESATKKVRQLSATDASLSRTAPRHARSSCTSRGNRNPKVATAARNRPQRIALRMELAPALGSTGTRQISRFTTSRALSSMNLRRASTFSPMSVVKISSAATASSSFT